GLRGRKRERRRLPADRDRRDRRVRRDGVDLPCPFGRRRVVPPGGVLRPHAERVRALWEAAVCLSGGARRPAPVIELALEGGCRIGGGEPEGRVGGGGRAAWPRGDGRLRREVDSPRPARGGGVDVPCPILGPRPHHVLAVGKPCHL